MDLERLSQIGTNLKAWPKKKNRKRTGSREDSKIDFFGVLNRTVDENSSVSETLNLNLPELTGIETLEGLLDDVHETGEALKRDAVFGPLSGYKKAVGRFLRYILDKCIEVDEIQGLRNPKTMQQKKYVVIRLIDEKLENLAVQIMKNQTEQLDILGRINEINGLLVDLIG